MSSIYIQEPPTNGKEDRTPYFVKAPENFPVVPYCTFRSRKVLLYTSVGDIDIELWSKEAPKACRNFVQLCIEGFYDNSIFHRIVKGFIAQTGDPTGTGYDGESIYGKPFKDEFHQRLRFTRRGLLAMANSGPNDNRSQFFFTLEKAPELDKKHTIFGKVGGNTIYNMIRLNEIEVGEEDRPIDPPKIFKTEILYNPFDDIEPRRQKSSKEKTTDDKENKKITKKGSKNFKLLSFGEEAEEDDEEVTEISKNIRIKSSHDVSKGKDHINDAAVEGILPPPSEGVIDMVRGKLSKKVEVKQEEDGRASDEEERRRNERRDKLKREALELKRELAGRKRMKREPQNQSIEDEEENKTGAVNELALQLKEEKKEFIKRKKEKSILKRGGSRESETLALLAGFEEKLISTKSNTDMAHEDVPGNSDVKWMAHSLTFESHEVKAKDASMRDEDTFDIYDPRNPINQRRREKTKSKK